VEDGFEKRLRGRRAVQFRGVPLEEVAAVLRGGLATWFRDRLGRGAKVFHGRNDGSGGETMASLLCALIFATLSSRTKA
jgi:hypothetical protein